MKRYFFLCTVLFFFSFPAILQSQSQSTEANRFLSEGQSFYAAGDYEAAQKAFKRALKKDKNLLAAYSGLGKIAVDLEKWDDASDQFGKILDRDPQNLEANYYRGIAYREIGKTRPKFANSIPLMNKLLEYQKAEKNFERVLAHDSLFLDVLYQYGRLQRYRDKYEESIWLAQRQVALKPELVSAQVGLLKIYRHYMISESEDDALDWLNQQPWQQATYFAGEKLRRAKNFRAADSVYLALLNQPLSLPIQPN